MTIRRPVFVLMGFSLALLLLIGVTIAAGAASAKSTTVIHRTALQGSPAFGAVNGEAKWKSKGGERELEIQIEDAAALKGTRLTVKIGAATIGKMTVGDLGRARLTRSTEAGQSVPANVVGKRVRVLTAQGRLVARGVF